MKTIALMISGKQGSGKTTLAKNLADLMLKREDFWVYTYKFADPLYEMQKRIYDTLQDFGVELPRKPDGALLQMLGTEWGRKTIDSELWVKIMQARISKLLTFTNQELWPRHRLIIIDDARFPNEVDALSEMRGVKTITLRLEAPEHTRKVRAEKWRTYTDHPSETALDDFLFDKIIFSDVNDAAAVAHMAERIVIEAI